MKLTEFLNARLDEDDAVVHHRGGIFAARVLREIAAKRTLLRYFTDPATGEPMSIMIASTAEDLGRGNGTAVPGSWVLRELAAVYSDHPDYDEGWKP